VFDFMPTRLPGRQDRMSAAARRRIVGLEATLFSETVRGPERLAYMLMPRLLALAERAWAAEPDWERRPDEQAQARARAVFMQQLGRQLLPRLDAELPELHYRIAPPGLVRQGDRVLALAQLPGMTLRYTSDGSVPRPDSPLVQGPITARGRIAVAAFDRNGRAGRPSFIDNP
jgi:hexosaminidase